VKNKLLLLLVILMALPSLAISMKNEQAKPEAVKSIKVLTANLHVAAGIPVMPKAGLDNNTILANLNKAVEIFKTVNADVILLQEVDFNSSRSANINQGKFLAEKLGMHLSSVTTFNTHNINYDYPEVLKNCEYGIAILSKQKPLNTKVSWLKNPPEVEAWPENERRVLLSIRLSYAENKTIQISNTHLDYRSRDNRKKQLEQIAPLLDKEAAVIGGDFNEPWPIFSAKSEEDEKLVRLHGWKNGDKWQKDWLRFAGLESCLQKQIPPTYPVEGIKVSIDHIFAKGKASVRSLTRIDSASVSDHHFVLAEIGLE